MAITKKICRVCEKEYEACHSLNIKGAFRWQEVACSPECGTIYLDRIINSRGERNTPKKARSKKESIVTLQADLTENIQNENGSPSLQVAE